MRFFLILLILLLPQIATAQTPVKLMTIEPLDTSMVREFHGRVTARSTVDLAFQTGGQIVDLHATEGARIPKGAVLAQLDLDPFQRSLDRAEANYELAASDLKRMETLGANVTPQAQIDAARTDAELAKVALDDARDALQDATLHAPFDALVAARAAERYATVSAGQSIVRLHDMSELWVEVQVPERIFRQVGASPDVEAVADLPERGITVPVEFRELMAETSSVGQTYRLSLAFTEEVPPTLLPGASVMVKATIARPTAEARTSIPVTAVRYAADGTPEVLVFTADDGSDGKTGTLSTVAVEIAPGPIDRFDLVAGPPEGTEIVAAGAARLKAGDTVRRYQGLLRQERSE